MRATSMTDLDKKFRAERVIPDTPRSRARLHRAAIGASLCGALSPDRRPSTHWTSCCWRQIRIVNQAAKWSHMLGGQTSPAVTFPRHHQPWWETGRAAIPGAARLVCAYSWAARGNAGYGGRCARSLLAAAVLCDDPVLCIDDRWLYERTEALGPVVEKPLPRREGPQGAQVRAAMPIYLVGCGYSAFQCGAGRCGTVESRDPCRGDRCPGAQSASMPPIIESVDLRRRAGLRRRWADGARQVSRRKFLRASTKRPCAAELAASDHAAGCARRHERAAVGSGLLSVSPLRSVDAVVRMRLPADGGPRAHEATPSTRSSDLSLGLVVAIHPLLYASCAMFLIWRQGKDAPFYVAPSHGPR